MNHCALSDPCGDPDVCRPTPPIGITYEPTTRTFWVAFYSGPSRVLFRLMLEVSDSAVDPELPVCRPRHTRAMRVYYLGGAQRSDLAPGSARSGPPDRDRAPARLRGLRAAPERLAIRPHGNLARPTRPANRVRATARDPRSSSSTSIPRRSSRAARRTHCALVGNESRTSAARVAIFGDSDRGLGGSFDRRVTSADASH